MTPSMLEALCDHLLEKPALYLDEMVVFLWDEFQTLVTSSIRRVLVSKGWLKKSSSTESQRAKRRFVGTC